MGYESKLYIVEQNNMNYVDKDTNEKVTDIFNRIIGTYDLCKMGSDFAYDVFDKELEGKIFVRGNGDTNFDEETDVDCYGEHLRYCDNLPMLIAELENSEKHFHYRRLKPIIAMLKEFEKLKNEFNHLIVIHYGH